MKIAFVLYGIPDKRSGGFLYDRYLIDHLTARGHDVKVFSQKEGFFLSLLFENSSKIISLILEFSPDIIIEDELNHASLFIANRYIKRRLDVKILSVVHHLKSDEKYNFLFRYILKITEYFYLKSCDAFIFNSRTTCISVEKLLSDKKYESIIVYPGKDNLPLKKKKERKSEYLHFLFTGNLIPRKNIHKLLKIFSRRKDLCWKFTCCGQICSQRYYRKLLKYASEGIASGQIEFTGRVSDEKLSELLSESDILIVPSEWEGFGIIYIEAMRSRVIPVATVNGGAVEIIDDSVDGFLISPGDSIKLESFIQFMIENPEQIRAMENTAYNKSLTFPTWNQAMTSAADFIEKLLDDF